MSFEEEYDRVNRLWDNSIENKNKRIKELEAEVERQDGALARQEESLLETINDLKEANDRLAKAQDILKEDYSCYPSGCDKCTDSSDYPTRPYKYRCEGHRFGEALGGSSVPVNESISKLVEEDSDVYDNSDVDASLKDIEEGRTKTVHKMTPEETVIWKHNVQFGGRIKSEDEVKS